MMADRLPFTRIEEAVPMNLSDGPTITIVGTMRGIRTRKITLPQLVAATYLMVAGGPYGLEDIVGRAGYTGAILILLVTPLLWSVPTALMVSELSSALPESGGYYEWVKLRSGTVLGLPGGVVVPGRQHLRHGDLSDALHPISGALVSDRG